MRRLVKSVGAGIGLATEAYAARKSSSASNTAVSQQNTTASCSSANEHDGEHEEDLPRTEDDEVDWDLDDAVGEQEGAEAEDKETGKTTMSVDHLVQIFVKQHPPPAELGPYELPCPVILPQRRPRDKSRGFVRAYAPVLSDCGIDEVTFMQFLKAFHQASKVGQASPVFTVINIAANVVGNVPSVAAMVTSISVMVVVGVAKEIQSRARSNSFLDQLNEKFFQPRGLYCVIMTYKPESISSHETVDITKTIQSKIDPSGSGWHEKMNKMKASSGKTYGELEMPLAASLIYPALDAAANATSDEKQKQNALKKSQKFVAGYYDRRAQAGENMESSLSVPQTTEFASRYSDPNHAANNGSLISLVTGGNINPQPRRDDRRERHSGRREKRGGLISSMIRPTSATKGGKKESPIRRLLKKDVLYLMIVNMPTEEELSAAKEMIAEAAGPARNH